MREWPILVGAGCLAWETQKPAFPHLLRCNATLMDSHFIQSLANLIQSVLLSIFLITTTKTDLKKRTARSRNRLKEPPLPPSLPVCSKTHELCFKNTTAKPYMPTIAVSPSLWELIGGPDWEIACGISTPEKRPLGSTASLAATFLYKRDNNGADKEVQELLNETRSIAADCLSEIDGSAARFFEPCVVRELQLARYLGGDIIVEMDGEARKGVLLSYDFQKLGDEEYEYTLHIHLENPVDGLPVIQHFVKSREWFQGSCGISFVTGVGIP